MLKRNLISLTMIGGVFSSVLSGYTLQQSVVEALNTNPVIQERLKNYRATQQDLNVAESEYYPQIDLRAAVGFNEAGEIKDSGNKDFDHTVNDVSYRNYESSLTFTQNLFDGFGTMHKVDFEEARILAAAYNYLEKSNDIAFRMTDSYINVLKTNELVGTAQENVQINESIYAKVKDLFEAGLTTDSEVKKIQSTLSLARSNLTVQKNNARDAEFKYRRILGRLPEVSEMKKPSLDIKMPESIERAALYAIDNNPSLLVSRYNIKGAQSLWKQRKKDYYPKLDLEVSQTFNDNDEAGNGFDQPDDRFKARLLLTYNLFRGGSDKANIQKHISKVNQEIEIQRDLKRQVIEGLDLSWSAYYMVEKQLKDLMEYSKYSENTLELYKEEYDLGRRSLLDLLSAQNDVINSRSQIITAEYDQMFAKYRILDAMGLLVVAINGTSEEFTSRVNLFTDDNAHEILDTVPVNLDVDNDKVADEVDLCDNSLKENNIMPYGCKKVTLDDDKDGVVNGNDECPNTPFGTKVMANGCEEEIVLEEVEEEVQEEEVAQNVELDSDSDGVIDADDSCKNTPEGYNVDGNGCIISKTLRLNFPVNSSYIPKSSVYKVKEFATFLQENAGYKINIVGHTSTDGQAKYNKWLSERRANRVMNALARNGIEPSRMSSDGRGEEQLLVDDSTQEGKETNRRVEVELVREDKGGEI